MRSITRRTIELAGLAGAIGIVVVLLFGLRAAPLLAQTPQPESLTLTFMPGRDAAQPGTVTLTGNGNQTTVTINVAPGAAGVAQPAHIHDGACPGVGAIKYPLSNVVDGMSTTTVNVALHDLLTGQYSINIHQGPGAEASIYTACVDLPARAGTHSGTLSAAVPAAAPSAAGAPGAAASPSAAASGAVAQPAALSQQAKTAPVSVQAPSKAAPMVQAPAVAVAPAAVAHVSAPVAAPATTYTAPAAAGSAAASSPAVSSAPSTSAQAPAIAPRLPNTGSGGLIGQGESSGVGLPLVAGSLGLLLLLLGLARLQQDHSR
jgi:hypothetical protein